MITGLPIVRLFGIEIRISFAWAAVLAVVSLIGVQQAAATAPGLAAPVHWLIGAVVALAFLASVIAHELGHALVGRGCGVETTTIQLGFVGGLAPLSIEASRARDELAIAIAGPATSLAVAGLALASGVAVGAAGGALAAIGGGLLVVGGLNLVLAGLSLLPGMPLDGGRVVRALAWAQTGDRYRAGRITALVGRILGWTTVGVGLALAFVDHVTEGLLVLLFGWLLATGSRTLDRRLGLEALLAGSTVGEATRPDVPRVAPNLTIDTFSERYEGEDAVSSLPVVEDEIVLGVIGAKRLQRLGRRRFAATRAEEVMATPPTAPFLVPADNLWSAVDLMNQRALDGLAVVVDGRLQGMVTRESIGEVIRHRMATATPAAKPGNGR